MKRFKTASDKAKDAELVFQVTGNHCSVKVVVRGEKQNLCDLLACAIEESDAIREVVNGAIALLALRWSMQREELGKLKRKGVIGYG